MDDEKKDKLLVKTRVFMNVKWGKEKFSGIECDTDEPPMLFKAQLFALSGVQPDRQKVMMKGAVLKDDDWGAMKLKDGVTLLMMGSADELPKEPTEKPLFMEDMSEQQLASALELPAGLLNLGNTCYMNATLQCLGSISELKQSLKRFSGGLTVGHSVAPADAITPAMRDLFKSMDSASTSISPIVFLQVLHMSFPRFAEKAENGEYAQQDANECWTEMVRSLQQKLLVVPPEGTVVEDSEIAGSSCGLIDQYMAGEFQVLMKCNEASEEEETKTVEKFYQLSCFIEKDVKYMHTGLKSNNPHVIDALIKQVIFLCQSDVVISPDLRRLEETITKYSALLDRDAQYTKVSKINRLPGYLSIQFVRFYYKEKESINAKILKDVKFPLSLDVYDLCTEELQKKLVPIRDRFKEEEDRRAGELQKAKLEGTIKDEKTEGKKTKKEPFWFPDDVGSNNSGYYELNAVLTHKGRSSASGHYVAWVKRKGDEWIMFDDDKVSPVCAEDILKLSGGGDWHCAYVLLYAPRILTVEEHLD